MGRKEGGGRREKENKAYKKAVIFEVVVHVAVLHSKQQKKSHTKGRTSALVHRQND
jgi:hypothetical protein